MSSQGAVYFVQCKQASKRVSGETDIELTVQNVFNTASFDVEISWTLNE